MEHKDINAQFKFMVSDVRILKSNDEDDWSIIGIAAGPEPDAAGERFALTAVEQVAEQINRVPIPLRDWHSKNSILGEAIGEVYKAWVTPEGELGVEARLDKSHPTAQYLREKLKSGKQFGLSVGGHVKQYIDEIEKAMNKKVRTFVSVVLDEVSVTTKPWYQPSFGSVISKAIDEAQEATSVEEGDDAVEDTVTPQADATEQNPADTATATSTGAQAPVEKSQMDALIDALVARVDARIDEKFSTLTQTQTAASQPESDTSENTEKSKADDDSEGLAVTKALDEIIRRLGAIEERVPESQGPDVLVQKSEIDELKEMLAGMQPSERLRFGFRAMYGDK